MPIGISEEAFARIFKPSPLSYYTGLLSGNGLYRAVAVELTAEEAAAVLQAHDYGLAALPPESLLILDRVMSKLKDVVWP